MTRLLLVQAFTLPETSRHYLRPANGFLLLAIYGLGYRLETIEANTTLPASVTRQAC